MGTITKPHGIRGEMALHTTAENPKLLVGKAYLAPPSTTTDFSTNAQAITVSNVRMHHQAALLTIEGIKDRTAAENYRRYQLFIERQKLPPLQDDEFYQTDLLGLDVFINTLDDENFLGELTSIDAPAGQEIWTITTDNDEDVLLPAVPEFVDCIDLSEEYIIITPPPGLIDLYLSSASDKDQSTETKGAETGASESHKTGATCTEAHDTKVHCTEDNDTEPNDIEAGSTESGDISMDNAGDAMNDALGNQIKTDACQGKKVSPPFTANSRSSKGTKTNQKTSFPATRNNQSSDTRRAAPRNKKDA